MKFKTQFLECLNSLSCQFYFDKTGMRSSPHEGEGSSQYQLLSLFSIPQSLVSCHKPLSKIKVGQNSTDKSGILKGNPDFESSGAYKKEGRKGKKRRRRIRIKSGCQRNRMCVSSRVFTKKSSCQERERERERERKWRLLRGLLSGFPMWTRSVNNL